ncbi:hypothetical protein [Vibrio sp. 10N.239.312.D08]|uniref:hypothetical protein n=1 Tax=Vibrio sp. 10N.239.312.D08 TaxID=3229978 RepID=UPI00354E4E85
MGLSELNIDSLLEQAANLHGRNSPSSQVSVRVQRILATSSKTPQYSIERGNRLISAFGKVQTKVFAADHPLVPPLI